MNGDKIYEPYAIEFSPDSKLAYITFFNEIFDQMELYQYDMQYIEDSLQFKQSERFIARGPVNGLQLILFLSFQKKYHYIKFYLCYV